MAKMKAGPVVTDNANFVIDAPFGEEDMKDPYKVRPLSFFGSGWADGLGIDYGANQDVNGGR